MGIGTDYVDVRTEAIFPLQFCYLQLLNPVLPASLNLIL